MQGEIFFMNNKFSLPTNVKQIGSIDKETDLKIYIEDYAYSYLQQYAKAGNYHERLAFLIGKNIKDGDKNIVLISGAIKTKYVQRNEGILNLTQETWNQAYEQTEKYFNGLEIVGMMQSQPGYGNYLNEKYVSQFKNNFNKLNQVFLLCDPIENMNVFYAFDNLRENLEEVKSYFIYYEKNNAMNEYMIDNKENQKNQNDAVIEKTDSPEIVARKRQFERMQKTNYEQKKMVNMLTGLSIVLFLICFIMGAGLIQNEDRISKLELRLKNFDGYCKNCDKNKIRSVFFEQENSVAQKYTEKEKTNELERERNITLKGHNQKKNDLNKNETNRKVKTKNDFDYNFSDVEKIPNNLSAEDDSDKFQTYVVKSGDSLSSISRKFFGSTKMIDKILELNDMDNADMIYIGKVLKLPNEF